MHFGIGGGLLARAVFRSVRSRNFVLLRRTTEAHRQIPKEIHGQRERWRLTPTEQKRNMFSASPLSGSTCMSSRSQPDTEGDDGLEAAVDQAIAACGGDMRSAIRALIVANDYLETEVSELMKAVSHAYARGRFQSYSG